MEAFALGLLGISGARIGFLQTPDPKFDGISFNGAAEQFKRMPNPSDYEIICYSDDVDNDWRCRSFSKESFIELIGCIEERTHGLSIEDFKVIAPAAKPSY